MAKLKKKYLSWLEMTELRAPQGLEVEIRRNQQKGLRRRSQGWEQKAWRMRSERPRNTHCFEELRVIDGALELTIGHQVMQEIEMVIPLVILLVLNIFHCKI